ncbi:MAG: GntR family transcriptional regulator [Acetobacteraceae bacterium]
MNATTAAPTDQDIYDRIFGALLSRRLPPGVRLAEVELATAFGVSRTKVRTALARLAQDGVIELRRNQGASVVQPTEAQTRHVFDLRAIVEPAIAADLARQPTKQVLTVLRRHLRLENAARKHGNDADLIRLTGEFHRLLAEYTGNPLVLRLLRELEVMTCLAILRFTPTAGAACPCNEHAELVDAIASGEPERAAATMRTHLGHVLEGLDFRQTQPSLSAMLDLSPMPH